MIRLPLLSLVAHFRIGFFTLVLVKEVEKARRRILVEDSMAADNVKEFEAS